MNGLIINIEIMPTTKEINSNIETWFKSLRIKYEPSLKFPYSSICMDSVDKKAGDEIEIIARGPYTFIREVIGTEIIPDFWCK
jgi:hypothetical protein